MTARPHRDMHVYFGQGDKGGLSAFRRGVWFESLLHQAAAAAPWGAEADVASIRSRVAGRARVGATTTGWAL